MAESTKNDIVIIGAAGGPFNIRGEGFGNARGVITIGSFPVGISIWMDSLIKGTLPVGAKGEVVLITAMGNIRKGTFPIPAPPLKIVVEEVNPDMRKQFEAFMRSMTTPAAPQAATK